MTRILVQSIKIGCLALLPLGVWAKVNVDVKVSHAQLGPDDALEYRVTIESSDQNLDNISIDISPKWATQGIQVSSPRISEGTQINMMNGSLSTTHQKTYEYQLSFDKAGRYVLSGSAVRMDGKVYRLRDVQVDVDSKYAQQQPSQQQGPFGGGPFRFMDRFFKDFDFGFRESVRPPRKEDVQLVFQPSVTRVLEGEPIWGKMVTYIHHNYEPHNLSPHFDLPPRSIFWLEYVNQSPKSLQSVGPGQDVAYQISEMVLFPLQPGKETLQNISLEGDLVASSASYPFKVKAKSIEIVVDPLPAPRPELPLVSDVLEPQFRVEKSKVSVDQPVQFEFSVEGVANLRLIDQLPIHVVENIDVVTQQDRFEVVNRAGPRFVLTKSGYFIFRKPGAYTLKTKSLTYYNPARKQYLHTEAQSTEVEVEGSSVPPTLSPTLASTDTPTSSASGSVLPLGFWILCGVVLLLIIILWGLWWTRVAYQKTSQKVSSVAPMSSLVQEFNQLMSKVPPVTVSDIFEFLQDKNVLKSSAYTESQFGALYERYLKSRFSGSSGGDAYSTQEGEIVRHVAAEIIKNVVKAAS